LYGFSIDHSIHNWILTLTLRKIFLTTQSKK
jgi:hypothetical protein